MNPLAGLILVSSLAAGPGWPGEPQAPSKHGRFEHKEGRFRCEVPLWEKSEDLATDRPHKVFGIFLTGPSTDEGPRASIAIEYYAPDNPMFKSAQDFISRQRAPGPIKLQGEKIGRVKDIKAGRLKAKSWVRSYSQPYPANSGLAKTVPVRSEYAVIESSAGFYVLTYSSPQAQFLSRRKSFHRVLDTFEILSSR